MSDPVQQRGPPKIAPWVKLKTQVGSFFRTCSGVIDYGADAQLWLRFHARLTGKAGRLALAAAMTDYLLGKSAAVFAVILMVGILSACAPQGDSSHSRIAVYSTAYLTDDNQVIYAVNSGTRPKPTPKSSLEWSWVGDGVLGAPSITINLASQTATFFKGDQPVGKSPVSTGREGYGTPTGSFKVIQKNKNHVSNLYGDFVDGQGEVVKANVAVGRDKCPPGARFRGAPMPYFMRIHGAVGMHAGYLPGYPASHGCIRMPRGAAQRFFENAPVGTPVRVVH